MRPTNKTIKLNAMHLCCSFQADKVQVKIKKSRWLRSKTLKQTKSILKFKNFCWQYPLVHKITYQSVRNLNAETFGRCKLCKLLWLSSSYSIRQSLPTILPIQNTTNFLAFLRKIIRKRTKNLKQFPSLEIRIFLGHA